MRTCCAMMASSVTPPAEEEGVEVDGAVEAGGVTVCDWGCSRTPLNGSSVNGTNKRKMRRLMIGDRKVAKEPRDSGRKDELIMSRRVLIDIYKKEYKV